MGDEVRGQVMGKQMDKEEKRGEYWEGETTDVKAVEGKEIEVRGRMWVWGIGGKV